MSSKQIKQYLLRLLAKRDYSEQELRNKLRARGEDETTIEKILDEFKAKAWQSDQRIAENLVHIKNCAKDLLRYCIYLNKGAR